MDLRGTGGAVLAFGVKKMNLIRKEDDDRDGGDCGGVPEDGDS